MGEFLLSFDIHLASRVWVGTMKAFSCGLGRIATRERGIRLGFGGRSLL